MVQGFIFPTTVYGTVSEVYGTAVPAYASTGGYPYSSGLITGMFGVLFDLTVCRLLRAVGGINNFDAVTYQPNNSNDYSVQQASAASQFVMAANDRSGSTPLVANNIAWMTVKGIATVNLAPSLTAPVQLAANGTPGQLGAYTPGTANTSTGVISGQSVQTNLSLLNSTTSAGAYPVRFT